VVVALVVVDLVVVLVEVVVVLLPLVVTFPTLPPLPLLTIESQLKSKKGRRRGGVRGRRIRGCL